MPFFYSQYLKDEKPTGGRTNSHPAPKTANKNQRRAPSNASQSRSFTKPGSLVWHSGTGASGKTSKHSNFKPLGYNSSGKRKKVVHFSTIEVQPFHFDWDLADDVFYTRAELTVMGQSRFDDAATLRQQRSLDSKGKTKTMDDVGISKKSTDQDMFDLLASALDDPDNDDHVSIRGIEHFVYPALQQEMIRRKKEVQKEVMGFVRSKRPDPQGWRLAGHSRQFSEWARNVAMQKGMKYCKNNAAADPEVSVSDDELARFEKSQDKMAKSSRALAGSFSYGDRGSAAAAFDPSKLSLLLGISEDKELDDPLEAQSPGTSTVEG
mmetsp:Transcript_13984/g.29904  ORF Transcript_13984/g.29904 Transcript_13984/m.29904 type:complete len:322 (-) Transcript_13984:334-1299(-)